MMAKDKKKICPMPLMGKCEKEKCAWWDDFTGHCAILSISRHGALGSFGIVQKEREE